ncbi:MAG: hypothetical protein K2H75_01190, partial [Muribaculaceae bacterium]|nr:hypothetical protein [Muribaculaceae bacterium]
DAYKTQWCDWCTLGWMALELIREWYPESVVSIAYHNGDPMEVTNSFAVAVSGFPGATINRGGVIDPYYGTGNGAYDFSVQYDLEDAMAVFAPGNINVSATYSEDGSTINVKGYSRFVENYDETPYKVGYMLVADGLTDPSWRQNNSYAQYKNSPTYVGTYLETLCNWPASVSDLVFNDVAIDVSGMMGVDGSVPEAVESGVVYEHEYSYNISNNKLVRDGAELHVMAFLIDKKTGHVVNANKTAVSSYVGVGETLGENVQPVSTVYYDLMGRRVEQPSNGLFIEVQKMSDGTQISHKVMKK